MPPALALHFGPYRLEGPQGPLWHHAEVVAVPPKALAVLWLLACQAGQVVRKATLLDMVSLMEGGSSHEVLTKFSRCSHVGLNPTRILVANSLQPIFTNRGRRLYPGITPVSLIF
jgi:hypothetical protein